VGQLGSDRGAEKVPEHVEGSSPSQPRKTRRRWQTIWSHVEDHPVLAVAFLAVLVGLVNIAWTAAHRRPGGLDIDEVSYLTEAFRWQRKVDPAHPFAVYSSVLDQDKGPVTMLVSVITLLVGPNTVAAAMAASAALHGVSSVAVAGITNRLAGGRAALIAGLVALSLPAALVAARSYQLAPAVGAALAMAVWALLTSSRGQRAWPMVGFGVAVGVLLLTRTMAVAFVPGLGLAAALHLDWSRRAVRNTVISVVVTLLVAGPWWWSQRESILEYLLGHGYGDAAKGYGASSLGGRVGQRVQNVVGGSAWLFVTVTIAILVGVAAQGWRRPRSVGWVDRLRSGTAVVWVTIAVGTAALISTANSGMYFELPLMVLAVSGITALGATLTPALRRPVAVVAVGAAVVTLGVSAIDSGGRRDFSQIGDIAEASFFPGLANYQFPTVEAEPRLGSQDNAVRRAAMDEWWNAARSTMHEVDSLASGGPVQVTVCGSGPQLSAGSMALVSELDQILRDMPIEWLATSAPRPQMDAGMQPRPGWKRILVLIDSEAEPFPGEESVDRCERSAQRLMWRTSATVELPDGGTVDVMTHPDND
jgi:hypothetical protein